MRRIVAAVIAAALVIALAWWVAGLSGTVGATIAGTTIETTTPVAAVGLVVLVLVLYVLVRLCVLLVTLPAITGRWRARRRRRAGEVAVTRTLVAIAAGNSNSATTEAARARRLLGDTPQTLLHAAEAARLAGRDDDAATLFLLLAERQDAAFLGLRGLFRQAMAREDWPEAARLAAQAELLHPGAGWLRTERSELAVRTGNWAQALALAGPGTPSAPFAVAAVTAEADPDRAMRMARRTWRDNPDFTPAALAYAARLQESGRAAKAADVLRTSWKTAPHPDLATQALTGITEPLQRLKEGQRLVAGNPGAAESHFLLARLSLDAHLPEEARRHAEAAKAAGMNQQRLWLLLADVATEQHGDTETGRLAQRDALRHATIAESDPGWRCDACGTAHTAWMPVCPACQTPGRIGWGVAPRPKLLAAP